MLIKESQLRRIIKEELLFEHQKQELIKKYDSVLSEGLFDTIISKFTKSKKVDQSKLHWNKVEEKIGSLFTTKNVSWEDVKLALASITDMSKQKFTVEAPAALLNALRKLNFVINPKLAKDKNAAIVKDLYKSKDDLKVASSLIQLYSDYSSKLASSDPKNSESLYNETMEEVERFANSIKGHYEWDDPAYRN